MEPLESFRATWHPVTRPLWDLRLNTGGDEPRQRARMARKPVARRRGHTTSTRRVGIAMNYCAGYIRQQENQQLGLPVDMVRTFSPRLQQLVGYGIYRGLIGHIDKKIPANLLLDATEDPHLLWDYAEPPKL